MADLSIQVRGDEETMAVLRKVGVKILDLSSSMSDIGKYLTGFFSGEVFASRGAVIGEPWPSLNQRYAAYKARRFPGRPPLIRTGLMNRSFKADSSKTSVRIFNTAPYFDNLQGGTGRMPARTMMKVDQQRQARLVDLIVADLAKEIA